MAGSLIITGQTIAKIIRNATDLSPFQIEELIAADWRECPSCNHRIDNSDVSPQWQGFPAGVKFDPTELELLLHLEGKIGRAAPHVQIGDFIPTIEDAEGICYTHPQNLPGIKIDGSSAHFFHRISNAFVSGGRKRRKISNKNHTDSDEHMRWHKTGKSSPIYDNDVIKGWKKFLVLYRGDNGKVHKTNWKMHQYHLGAEKDEKHGEYVVCRVFCQVGSNKIEKSPMHAVETDPTTPNAYPPQPRRLSDSPFETELNRDEEEPVSSAVQPKAEAGDHLPRVARTSPDEVDYAGARLPPLRCNDDIHEMPLPVDYPGLDAPSGSSDLDYYAFLRTAPDLFPLPDSFGDCPWPLDGNEA
ncbi:unnamed protein product [Alopecurus aequalis]